MAKKKHPQPVSPQTTPSVLPETHLSHLFRGVSGTPRYVLFLGAGASKESGIPLAREMIESWRRAFHEVHAAPGEGVEACLRRRDWNNTPAEYGELFGALYISPPERREQIERYVNQSSPSIGYAYLAGLMEHGFVQTVFTTNFDDLVNEACHAFTDRVRPIVCAHDSSVKLLDMLSSRPKIIKLHGDYLFDNIKNLPSELDGLEENMKQKLEEAAQYTGMIVIGYSGNDRSIMAPLAKLIESPSNLQRGVYWCVHRDADIDSLPSDVMSLARSRPDRFWLVRIEGFDHLMANVYDACNLPSLAERLSPARSVSRSLNRLRVPPASPADSSRIERDLAELQQRAESGVTQPIGCMFRASMLLRGKPCTTADRSRALEFLVNHIRQESSPEVFELAFWQAAGLYRLGVDVGRHTDDLVALVRHDHSVFSGFAVLTWNIAMSLVFQTRFADAADMLKAGSQTRAVKDGRWRDRLFEINWLFVESASAQTPLGGDHFYRLSQWAENVKERAEVRLGACILTRRFDMAEGILRELLAVHEAMRRQLYKFPILELLFPHVKDNGLRTQLSDAGYGSGALRNHLEPLLQSVTGDVAVSVTARGAAKH